MQVILHNFPADFDEPGREAIMPRGFIGMPTGKGFFIYFLEIGLARDSFVALFMEEGIRLREGEGGSEPRGLVLE